MRSAFALAALTVLLLSRHVISPNGAEAAFPTIDPGYQQSDFLTGFPVPNSGAGPAGIAFDTSGHIFVADAPAGTLSVFASTGGTATSSYPIGGFPIGVATDNTGRSTRRASETAT